MKKRLLCVSWTSLITVLYKGAIRPEQLDDAIFYFGCKLQHVKTPWELDENYLTTEADDELPHSPSNELTWQNGITRREADELHSTVWEALKKAMDEGRAAFRCDEPNSYKGLNGLLELQGIQPLPEMREDFSGESYSYPGVRERVKKGDLPLQVIF